MSFTRFLSILKARWRLAVGIFATIVVATGVLSKLEAKQYVAAAQVVVEIFGPDPVAGTVNQIEALPSYLATQLDIISSDRVVRRAAEVLKLDQDPSVRAVWLKDTQGRGDFTAWLVRDLQRRLVVTPSRESNVISIGCQAPNPGQAAEYANGFAQAYIDVNVQLKVQPASQYTQFFADQVKALRADLEAKQKSLQDYQRENGIVPTDSNVNIENTRLADLSTQVTVAEAQSRETRARLKEIQANPDALPEVLQNGVVANLKQQLSGEQVRSAEMLNRLGPNHPDYMREQEVINDLQARIGQETRRIVGSIAGTAQTNARRANDVRAALEEQKQRLMNMKQGQDARQLLENDVLNAQKNLEAVNARLAQTSLESRTQQSNVVLLSAATDPVLPSSPNVRLNVLVAMFLGGLLAIASAIALEMRGARIRAGDELPLLLGVPLLGTLSARPYRLRRLAGPPA